MAANEIASDQKSEIKNHHSSIKHTATYYNTEIYLHVATGEHGLGVVSPLDMFFACKAENHELSA